MMGGSGNDIYLVDSSGDQVIEGAGEGTQDLIYAFTSFQLAAGQEIERLIAVVNTNITLTGNELDNFIQGGSGDDRLVGNEGNDSFNGGLGNDTLLGGHGNDVLYGGPGNDSMVGGGGNDIFFVDSFADQVIEVVGGGTLDVVYSSTSYQLADGQEVERLISLINSNVILTGNELGNFIQGGGGNDILTGHEGNDNLNGANGADTLLGGAGDDTLTGGAGNDSMMGGSGNDVYLVDSSGDQVIEGAGEGTQDLIYAFTSYQLAAGQEIERLIAVVNTNLTLTGNELDNFIQGGGGNDILSGGAGIDTVVGGVGNDTFILTPLQADRDIFPDFNFTQDRFQVSNAAFGGGLDGDANGVLDANRFLASAAGVATTADQRFIYNTTSRLLIYDSNGNGAGGESVIGVLNASTLTAANFTVV